MHGELTTFRTALGWCAMLGRGEELRALTFGHRDADAALAWLDSDLTKGAGLSRWNPGLARRITAVLDGEPDDFRDVVVDLGHLTAFSRRVARACRNIGWGETKSYGELAASVGSPRAARAVGHVMATNRTPLVVPCHRVVGSGGGLGGFSAPDGLAMKRRLLTLESAVCCRG
jgi:methylated-DNA-[protein]-cysteine S-methyltransferase